MPIYEFECEQCERRFEELVAGGTESIECPRCGSRRTRRLISAVSPPGRLTARGPKARDSESRRREREVARGERLAATRRQRGRESGA